VIDALEFGRLLADQKRLGAFGLLAIRPRTAREVATEIGLSERDALRLLGRLASSGLVVNDDGVYRLDVDAFRSFAAELNPAEPADPEMFRNLTDDEAGVAARFFRGRRLIEIPAAEGKRRAVLRRIVQEFEPGRRYSEAQVNLMLGMFHEDHASLRRYLVDEHLLDRDPAEGSYWRIGGPVEIS
jgi:hypothetical protein